MYQIILLTLSISVVACGVDYKEKKSNKAPASFFGVREQIIKPQCISCHPVFESHESLMEMVVAGKPEASKLFTIVEQDEMPPTGRKVATPKKEYLRHWIEEGANL